MVCYILVWRLFFFSYWMCQGNNCWRVIALLVNSEKKIPQNTWERFDWRMINRESKCPVLETSIFFLVSRQFSKRNTTACNRSTMIYCSNAVLGYSKATLKALDFEIKPSANCKIQILSEKVKILLHLNECGIILKRGKHRGTYSSMALNLQGCKWLDVTGVNRPLIKQYPCGSWAALAQLNADGCLNILLCSLVYYLFQPSNNVLCFLCSVISKCAQEFIFFLHSAISVNLWSILSWI